MGYNDELLAKMQRIKGTTPQATTNTTTDVYNTQLLDKMNKIKGIQTIPTTHAQMAQQGHQALAQKQVTTPITTVVPVQTTPQRDYRSEFTNFLKAQGNSDDVIQALLSKMTDKDIEYELGKTQAVKQVKPYYGTTPVLTTSMDKITGNTQTGGLTELQATRTKENDPVYRYDKSFGQKEAEEELQGLDFSNGANSTKYMEYKSNLEDAKKADNIREISKYENLIKGYRDLYNKNFAGTVNNTDIVAVRKSLEDLAKDVAELEARFMTATTQEEKRRIAEEYNRIKDIYDEKYKLYSDAILYDETFNNNIFKDTALSWDKGVRAGTARTINGGWAIINKLAGLDAADIDPNGLLKANNKQWDNIYQATGAGDNDINGSSASANWAWGALERIHNTFPNSIKATELYNKIKEGKYTGTVEDLAKDLDEVAKDVYQTFKDQYTQDELDAQAEQLRHNEIYGPAKVLPNATNTTAEMAFPFLVGYATGGVGELAGGGSMATAGTIANKLQQLGSYSTIGLGAGSGGLDQALENGATYNQGLAYGALRGATEAGTEMLGGETVNRLFGQYGKTALGKVFGKAIDKLQIQSKLGQFLANQASGVAAEMTEEMISEAVDPLWQVITYNPDALPSNLDEIGQYIKNVINAGIEAIPSTLMMQGGGMLVNANNVQRIENGLIKSINENPELSQIAKNQLINEVKKAAREVKLDISKSEADTVEGKILDTMLQNQIDSNKDYAMEALARNDFDMSKAAQDIDNGKTEKKEPKYKIGSQEYTKQEIKEAIKTNPNGSVLKDEDYLDFLVEREIDRKNISNINFNEKILSSITPNVPSTIEEWNNSYYSSDEETKKNILKNAKQNIYNNIDNKRFTTTKQLKNQDGKDVTASLNVQISKSGIDETLNKNASAEKLIMLTQIDKLISTSKDGILYPHDDKGRKNNGYVYLYNTAQINNELYAVRIDIRREQDGIDNFRVHRINVIKEDLSTDPYGIRLPAVSNDKSSLNKSINQTRHNVKPLPPSNPSAKDLEDIANLTTEDVTQQEMNYKQKADKETANRRKFFDNAESSPIIAEQTKNRVNPTNYERKANLDTLEAVRQDLDEKGNDMIEEWKHKAKNFTDRDVALGAILIERYQQNGDWASAARTVEKLADMGTEAGRAVQMYSIFQRLSPETMEIYQQKELNKAFENMKKNKTGKWIEQNKDKYKLSEEDIKFIHEQVEKAQQATDEETKQRELSKIENRINDKLPPEDGQAVRALRRIAMLFNPKTQVRNIAGNTIIMPVNDVADTIGTGIDKAISKITGIRTTNLPNPITKAKGFAQGVKAAVTDYKTNTRTTASGSKYEFDIGAKSFNENTPSKVRNAINRKLNGINRLLSAVMSGGDRPFYEAAYKNSLEGQMKANKVSEPTEDMIDIAVNEALQRTWNDDNEYTKAVLGIRRAMNKFNIHGFGLGDLIIPFAKTPANLTKAMVEYSPAGFIESVIDANNMRKALSRGELTPAQQKKFVSDTSKAITGTLLYLIAGTLVALGKLTGSADDDTDVKNFEQNVMGIQPYSVKIGDKTYTYSWANPINFPLAVMADNYKMSKENASTWDKLNNVFKVAGNVLVDNSFLSGIKDLFSKDSITEGIIDAVTSFPESLIPTFVSQLASLGDTKQRQTFEYDNELGTVVNKIKNKIPGLRNTLQPQVNTFGEEIENQNNAFNAFLNPANVREAKVTPSQQALYDVYEETKDKTIFPMQAPYYLSTGDEKKILTSKDRVDYQKASGQYVTEVYDGLFNQDAFNEAYHVGNEGKVEILKQIASDGNTKGKEAVGVTTKTTDALNEKIDSLEEAGIPLADYYLTWYAQKNVSKKSAKKTAISQTVDYINEGDHKLNQDQKNVLYEIFNVN